VNDAVVMAKDVRPVHHADRRRDVIMPYAPALLVRRGSLLFLSGVTAAPVYHSHPHREEEFNLPRTMREQAALAMDNLTKTLEAAGCTIKDLDSATRYLPAATQQEQPNRRSDQALGSNLPRLPSRCPARHHPMQDRDQRDRRRGYDTGARAVLRDRGSENPGSHRTIAPEAAPCLIPPPPSDRRASSGGAALAALPILGSTRHAAGQAPAKVTKVLDFSTGADVAKAEQEGEVVYYGHDGEAAIGVLLEAFRKDFPKIKTNYVRLQTGALYAKITAERSANRYLVDISSSPTSRPPSTSRRRLATRHICLRSTRSTSRPI
jgi:enamine deaminase RidA (YjgF/YER057c/UK114 family)